MSKYRSHLPQLGSQLFMTDGGLETTLIFHEGLELPAFAAYRLLDDEQGRGTLRAYYSRYAAMAIAHGMGLVLESPTWRANADWGARLGNDTRSLADANRAAIGLMREVRAAFDAPDTPIVISGNLGPRGDGYRVDDRMDADTAMRYHLPQIRVFADTEADMVAAFTMTYPEEAIGVTMAAQACGMPVAISFTVETDGRLPSGEALGEAIRRTDEATDSYPAYYMINCAHPTHFAQVLEGNPPWALRLRGLRANASRRSHAELDDSTELDDGNPAELGDQYRDLRARLPRLTVVGGCCGTDHRHVDAICRAMKGQTQKGLTQAIAAPI